MGTLFLTKEARIYSGAKTASSINGAGKSIGRTLNDINQSKILYDPPPRVTEIKTKVNKWYLLKLKNFCTAKETISKVKRQPSERGQDVVNETSDKRLISKIYK